MNGIMEVMSKLIGQSKYLGMDKLPQGKPIRTSKRSSIKDHKRRTQQGRNELCNCGSGLKFKKCCGKVIND